MKKYLIPEFGKFYKANLHCHSTVSDGGLTPSELKEEYMKLGYSIIAYSDHDVMIPHRDLRDEGFLPLTAIEFDVSNPNRTLSSGSTCHFNFIALDENIESQPLDPDYERSYTPECITDMMTRGRLGNFFVTYNHPSWSQESYNEYSRYNGMHAMEIINHLSAVGSGAAEWNDRVYDDMLRCGKRIFCIAADDTHSKYKQGTEFLTLGGAFTMIKAESLDYKSIANALVNGHFYSSEGPEIKSLWFEDGRICIDCSTVDRIIFTSYPTRGYANVDDTGEGISHAEYTLKGTEAFVRVTLIDKRGKRAYTNAYFTDDLKG